MLLENRVYALWVGKQTAKGAPNNNPSKRLIQVAGELGTAVDTGSENWSDLSKFGSVTQWVNSVLGNGTPGIEATPTELAYLLWLFHGAESVSAIAGPPAASRHEFVPSLGGGHWATFATRMGQSIIRRHQFNDCRIGQLVIEGSTGAKAVRVTPTVISLDPGEVRAADPAAAIPASVPFLYTDGAGAYEVDGDVFRGQSQFTLTLNEGLTPVYGDDTRPHDVAQGDAGATIAATLLLDSDANALWNEKVYGSAAPAAGSKPLSRVAPIGGYGFRLEQTNDSGAVNGRAFDFESDRIQWAIPDYPGPNPDGGSTEIAMAGTLRGNGTTPSYTIGVETGPADVAFTV
jgi:hypothetical protein